VLITILTSSVILTIVLLALGAMRLFGKCPVMQSAIIIVSAVWYQSFLLSCGTLPIEVSTIRYVCVRSRRQLHFSCQRQQLAGIGGDDHARQVYGSGRPVFVHCAG
jgi:hypothetical protein